ncbi:MAG: hypothetical protein ACI808_002825 [Paraglaciecola sp.]|jgi:hypothetical protein
MNELDSPLTLTQQWIEKVIIGLNFCPFAKREYERRSIRYVIHSQSNEPSSITTFLDELHYLDKHPEIETSLLIFVDSLGDFEDYLNTAGAATALLEQSGYSGLYQLATFHPQYCFDGEAPDDPANFTNRAPYPILHILREASIERVLRNYKSPEDIPNNNIVKAREMGIAALRKLTE